MTENSEAQSHGWQISRSISSELDMAIHFLYKQKLLGSAVTEYQDILEAVPPAWEAELQEMGVFTTQYQTILEVPAFLTGVLFEEDYSLATLPIRELSLTRALELAIPLAEAQGIKTNKELGEQEQFIELATTLFLSPYRILNVLIQPDFERQIRGEIQSVTRILQGQPAHDRFWHWMDRFYYELYRPWRETRRPFLEGLEQQAVMALGAPASAAEIPNLDWLPDKNAIYQIGEVREAVMADRLRIIFWAEPFGAADSWSLMPGLVAISFSQPGQVFDSFFNISKDLALRTQALADPTRLIILRLIRYFGMTNTDMAKFLGLARPTVSVHAKILREAGLIRTNSEGRSAHHEIQSEEVRRLFRELAQFLDLPADK